MTLAQLLEIGSDDGIYAIEMTHNVTTVASIGLRAEGRNVAVVAIVGIGKR